MARTLVQDELVHTVSELRHILRQLPEDMPIIDVYGVAARLRVYVDTETGDQHLEVA